MLSATVAPDSRLDKISRQATPGDQMISKRGTRHGVEVASGIFSPAPRQLARQRALAMLLQEAPSLIVLMRRAQGFALIDLSFDAA